MKIKYEYLFLIILALVAISIGVIMTRPTQQGLDIQGGIRVVLQADYSQIPKEEREAGGIQQQLVTILENRVNAFGLTEPVIQTKGTNQIIVELPGVKDEAKALDQLKSTALLEFRHFRDVSNERRPNLRYEMEVVPATKRGEKDRFRFFDNQTKEELTEEEIQEKIIARSPLIVSGKDLETGGAQQDFDPNTGEAVVSLRFNRKGTEDFARFTRSNEKEYLAIILDNQILMVPRINEAILNGRAQIEGNMTVEDASRLAGLINAGALPAPLDVISMQSVSATLGKDAVDATKVAGIIGLGLVLLFMLLYYRLPGLLANIALVFYALFSLAIFKLIPVTLTLPGIAGFILSIGMAVDANILIFERLKEELRSGKTLRAAVDAGFARAWGSIRDSNACSLITAAILYQFGTGPIKGFASTLGIGVLVSMFTAITVTRTMLHLLINVDWAQNPKWYGLGVSWISRQGGRWLDIIGKRNYYFLLSALIIVPGLIFLGMGGLKPGIDFSGGSIIQVQFDKSTNPNIGLVRSAVADAGLRDGGITTSGSRLFFIRTDEIQPSDVAELKSSLASKVGPIATEPVKDSEGKFVRDPDTRKITTRDVFEYSSVGPVVSKELTTNAVKAILFSALLIVLYLAYQFRQGGFVTGFRYGMSAIMATLHDVLILLGVFAILGYLRGWEIDSLFVTAALTVIGFSTHDTIVIFDRIRENWKHREKDELFEHAVNRSILQTFARSINTSMTVILVLVAMLVMGGSTIKLLNWALLIGVVVGTYSSIFNASPILVVWENIANRRRQAARAAALKPGETKAMVTTPTPPAPKAVAPAKEVAASDNGSAVESGTASPAQKAKVKSKKKRRY